jgi:hypothetical protein
LLLICTIAAHRGLQQGTDGSTSMVLSSHGNGVYNHRTVTHALIVSSVIYHVRFVLHSPFNVTGSLRHLVMEGCHPASDSPHCLQAMCQGRLFPWSNAGVEVAKAQSHKQRRTQSFEVRRSVG